MMPCPGEPRKGSCPCYGPFAMELRVNGKAMEVPEGTTVHDLVERLGLRVTSVAVEHNGEPVQRTRYSAVVLEAGDVLEVVRPVQGGERSLEAAKLYLVTDAAMPADVLETVVEAGVGIVQLRMKDADAVEVMEAADAVQSVCVRHGVPFIVNDRPDLARALGADGVHLGQGDLLPRHAREILGPQAIIGRSTHSTDDIARALDEHAKGCVDYIAVGPVHETPTKPGRSAVGYDLVRHAAEHVAFPWFAIGGIDASNVGAVVEAGARRVVVVRAIAQAPDPVAAARRLAEALG